MQIGIDHPDTEDGFRSGGGNTLLDRSLISRLAECLDRHRIVMDEGMHAHEKTSPCGEGLDYYNQFI